MSGEIIMAEIKLHTLNEIILWFMKVYKKVLGGGWGENNGEGYENMTVKEGAWKKLTHNYMGRGMGVWKIFFFF